MFLSRPLVLAFFSLALASAVQAADSNVFSVLVNDSAGQPIMFQSAGALKKGDVINIQSFNAAPVMILQIAMCDRDCPRMHLVKTMSLTPYFVGVTHMNEDFVVPEDGRVSFWMQRIGGIASVPIATHNGARSLQIVDPFLSFTTPELYPDSGPMPVSALQLDDNALHARFYHRTFVTVRLADANG